MPVLQKRHDHMAIVVDEFGSAIGMITIEDILREVVGEVVNVGYTLMEALDGDGYLMDGRAPLMTRVPPSASRFLRRKRMPLGAWLFRIFTISRYRVNP